MIITRTYAVGTNSTVVRLDNHTGPWVDISPALSPVGFDINDVMADPNDPDRVAICGQFNGSGTGILVSSDAGVTWNIPTFTGVPPKEYIELWWVDSNTIWAVGDGTFVALSTDGGLNFEHFPINNSHTSGRAIHALSDQIAVVATNSTNFDTDNSLQVWKTVDGGLNWSQLNGGVNITELLVNPAGLADGIWISDDESTIIVTTNYHQYLSTDSGASFTLQPVVMTRSGRHLTWYPSYGTPDYYKHVGGPVHHVFTTTNAGVTWNNDRSSEGIIILGAHFYSSTEGYYTQNGGVLSTNDGALTGTLSYTAPLNTTMTAVWTQLRSEIYRLVDCEGEYEDIYAIDSILSAEVGHVINLTGITAAADGPLPEDVCFQVEIWEDPTVPISTVTSVTNSFQTCLECNPPEPTPIELGEACDYSERFGEPGFSVKNCDPDKYLKIKKKFSDAVYQEYIKMRFGIGICCDIDLDEAILDNTLLDLGEIYDPELCVSGEPIPFGCCLQPCNAEAELIVPNFMTCPAPINASATLTVG